MGRHFEYSPYGFIADTCNWGYFSRPSIWSLSPVFPFQLKEKHLAKSAGGFSLLRTAIETENAEMFQAVMATYSDKLAEEEVRRCTLVEVAY